VLAPGTTDTTNAAAQQAQSDLTTAYVNAAGRPITATTTADLGNLKLQAGVYSGPSKGALSLTGPLTLDGAGNANSVFIFQTDSTLITASGSTVKLINGAQACNVFWQVGSSATLGTGSVFSGNILALTDITVTNSVTVHGRALARNGQVTLDNDTFTKPSCQQSTASTTTTSTTSPETVTTQAISPTTVVTAAQLPRTGSSTGLLAMIAFAILVGGLTVVGVSRRRRTTI
jgi:type VI secretion system secreted protein VgrG